MSIEQKIFELRNELIKQTGKPSPLLRVTLSYEAFDAFFYQFHIENKFKFTPADVSNFTMFDVEIRAGIPAKGEK